MIAMGAKGGRGGKMLGTRGGDGGGGGVWGGPISSVVSYRYCDWYTRYSWSVMGCSGKGGMPGFGGDGE